MKIVSDQNIEGLFPLQTQATDGNRKEGDLCKHIYPPWSAVKYKPLENEEDTPFCPQSLLNFQALSQNVIAT